MIFKGPAARERMLALLDAITQARSSTRVDPDTDRRVRHLSRIFNIGLLAQVVLLIGAIAALLVSILGGYETFGMLGAFALLGGYAIENLTMWPVLEEIAVIYSDPLLERA